MERIKSILALSLVLACVAPAMAADWYEIPSSGDYGAAAFTGFNYNPNPDPAAVADWYTTTYVAPFSSYVPSPYYEDAAETAGPIINDPTAEVRFNMITSTLKFDATDVLTAGTMYMGDTYWPWNYTAFGGNYSSQEAKQEGGTVTLGTLNFGRPNDFATVDMETNSLWNNRSGSFNVGTINVLSTNTTATYLGRSYSLIGNYVSPDNTNVTTTIGDINLNEHILFLHANAGHWSITGDIGLVEGASAGNMVMMIGGGTGYYRDQAAYDADGGAAGHEGIYCADYYGTVDIKWTTLLDMIDNGQLYAKYGLTYNSRFRPGYEFTFEDLFAGTLSGVTKISRQNMYDLLDIIDNGDGTVNIIYAEPVNVPEPATMLLLGLGAVLSFRRKR